MNGPCFVTWQHVIDLTEFGFDDTSTLVGHVVSSPREREKRDRRMKERDMGERKMNESEETEEIKAFPSTFTCCKDSRPYPAISQYQLHDTFASPHHPTGQRVYSVFGTPIRKFMLDLEVFLSFFFFFFFFWTAQKSLSNNEQIKWLSTADG